MQEEEEVAANITDIESRTMRKAFNRKVRKLPSGCLASSIPRQCLQSLGLTFEAPGCPRWQLPNRPVFSPSLCVLYEQDQPSLACQSSIIPSHHIYSFMNKTMSKTETMPKTQNMSKTQNLPKTQNMPNSPVSDSEGEEYINLCPHDENPAVGAGSLVTDVMYLSGYTGHDKPTDGTVIASLMVPGPLASGPRKCKLGGDYFGVDSEYLFVYYNETPHLCFGSERAETAFLASAHERGVILTPASAYPLSMALSFCPAPTFRSSLPAGDFKCLMEYVKKAHSNEVSGQLNVRGDPSSAWAEIMALHLHKRIMDPELSQVSVMIDELGKPSKAGITHVSGQITDAFAKKGTTYVTVSFGVCARLHQERFAVDFEIADLNLWGVYFYKDDDVMDVGKILNVPEAKTAKFELQEFLRAQPWGLTD